MLYNIDDIVNIIPYYSWRTLKHEMCFLVAYTLMIRSCWSCKPQNNVHISFNWGKNTIIWSIFLDFVQKFCWRYKNEAVCQTTVFVKDCRITVADLRVNSVSSCWQGPLKYCSQGPNKLIRASTQKVWKSGRQIIGLFGNHWNLLWVCQNEKNYTTEGPPQ